MVCPFFECSKKGFSNRIVMRATSGGKRLVDAVLLKKLCENSTCVLLPSIAMECQMPRFAALLISISKCSCNQVRTDVARYSVTHDSAAIKIQNNTEISPIVVAHKICNIAAPHWV